MIFQILPFPFVLSSPVTVSDYVVSSVIESLLPCNPPKVGKVTVNRAESLPSFLTSASHLCFNSSSVWSPWSLEVSFMIRASHCSCWCAILLEDNIVYTWETDCSVWLCVWVCVLSLLAWKLVNVSFEMIYALQLLKKSVYVIYFQYGGSCPLYIFRNHPDFIWASCKTPLRRLHPAIYFIISNEIRSWCIPPAAPHKSFMPFNRKVCLGVSWVENICGSDLKSVCTCALRSFICAADSPVE